MGKKRYYLFYSSLFIISWGIICNASVLFASDSLALSGRLILNGQNDTIRIKSNNFFLGKIKEILISDPEMNFTFDSIKNLSIVISPDKKIRILSWVLPKIGNISFTYFGYIQTAANKKEPTIIYELIDKTSTIEDAEDAKLSPDKWFGAIYYKILVNETSGKKIYTLLGWKGNNQFSTKKVIDAFYFITKRPVFATSIFKADKKIKNRLILEYNALAVASLKFNEKDKMIVFDHLSPPEPNQTGMYENYGPDFSYDGLKFKKGKWELMRDIQLRNDYEKNTKFKSPQHGLTPKKN